MIKTFTNPKPWHKYNPIYEYEVYEGKINVEGLADKILELEQTILKDRNVLAEKAWKQLLDKSRTNQFTQFNLLQLDQTKFLKDKVGEIFKGVISGVTEWGIYVELEKNKCEGLVKISSIKGDFYVFDKKTYSVIGRSYKNKYQLGDTVKIKIKNVDLEKKQINFILI